MFKTKYFWKGYLLGFGISLLGVIYMLWTLNTTRSIEAIKGFNELRFENLKGDTLSIKKISNQPVFVNYWATYCGPCLREMPLLLEFSKKYPQIKIWLLTDENTDVISRFVAKHPELKELNFAHLIINGKATNGFNTIQGQLPSSFLVKSSGTVLWINDGMLVYKTAQEMLDSIQKRVPEIKNIVVHN